jgi:hypothetical protein
MDYGKRAAGAAILQLPVSATKVCDADHVKDHGTAIFVGLKQFSLRNQRFHTVTTQKFRSESSLITVIFQEKSRLFSNRHDSL